MPAVAIFLVFASRLLNSLVKHPSDPLDVLAQAWLLDVVKNRKIDLVGYERLVEFGGYMPHRGQAQTLAKEGEVDVRPRSMVTFGP